MSFDKKRDRNGSEREMKEASAIEIRKAGGDVDKKGGGAFLGTHSTKKTLLLINRIYMHAGRLS